MRRYLLPLLLLSASCTKTIYVPQVSHKLLLDTIVEVVPDSSLVKALLECDSAGEVRIRELQEAKGRMASSQLEIKDNRLTSATRWQTKVVDRIIEIRDTTTVIEYREVVREVKHVPKIYRWSLWIAIATIGAAALKFVMWLR